VGHECIKDITFLLQPTSLCSAVQCSAPVHQCGPGQLRNKRQDWMLREEERMAEERELQWATRLKGSSLLQKGHIFHG
jgi:hypothetical protein